jgi:hypothetical protein
LVRDDPFVSLYAAREAVAGSIAGKAVVGAGDASPGGLVDVVSLWTGVVAKVVCPEVMSLSAG